MSSISSSPRNQDESESISNHPNPKWIYDVFLTNFCVKEDICKSFASHLYSALTEAGVHTFWDDGKLRSDEDQITPSLLHAIGGSRMSIIVFSWNYDDESRWCLQVLEKIMECRRTIDQMVVLVFYEVDPSDVYKQICGEEAFYLRERILLGEEDELTSWKAELLEASNISEFVLTDSRNQNKDMKDIVKHVTHFLDKIDLFIAEHPVGLESRVQGVTQLLDIHKQSKHPPILGILGTGGVGKTTIAKAIYNQIGRNFEAKSILLNIHNIWEQNNGPISLQERLISDICKTTKIKIETIEVGKSILIKRLRKKRIFLVLDGVYNLDQFNALCVSREWIGEGSIIIITTRDKKLLMDCRVDCVYEMKIFNFDESVELLCWHAFKQASPREDFVKRSEEIVSYVVGLPLVLEVLGSHLFGRVEWRSMLLKLRRNPHRDLIQILKVCLDELNDEEKILFLDLAQFFIGMDRDHVIHVLNSSSAQSISVLVKNHLVTIDENNKVGMHDELRQVGREIMMEEPLTKPESRIFDVFLSFRGEDSRASFISHLYSSLQNAGIYVFKDDDEIQRGDQISVSLLRAIRRSRISIIVLSKNYGNSRWCLQELENIMESRRTMGLMVVPVFYGVDPSDVRQQTGEFGEGFKNLIKGISVETTVKNWRIALLEVGGIAGVVVLNSRNESDDIKKVVEQVTGLLDKTDLFVAEHPVGVEDRVERIVQLMSKNQLLGVSGMGGLGKSTIAKAVYNRVRHNFEAKCFLLNIREACEQNNGNIVSLQQKLLSDIYKTTKINIDTVESGKTELRKRLSQKTIFLVLDDVNEEEQLDALCGSRTWFSRESRIIITTRDDDLLINKLEVDFIYKMKEMKKNESLELFSWHAFKQSSPREGFADLSRDVVEYCEGLPLALQVIGSFLRTRGEKVWKSVLEKLKIIPHKKVQKKLRINFDGLGDDKVQEIFLDIAFFFIGMDRDEVIEILNECGHFAEIGIDILVQQSLVTVDNKNKLGMHSLLRDMGREIVREKSPEEVEKRNRLWFYEDTLKVLSKNTRMTDVHGLSLKSQCVNTTTYYLETKAFEKMDKLRLLQLAGVQLDGNYKYLSTELRWLCWHGFPLKYTPANFYQESLVSIDLKYSNLERVWKRSQLLKKLKFLNLSHSPKLTQTPNFSNLPNLKKLILKDCTSLSSISHTIGNLNELLLINLKNCTSLRELPRSIYKLKSLKTLILSGCSKIDKLEEDIEQMESLTTLVADNTAITRVPFAIVRSKSVGYISLCGYEGFSRNVFPSIIRSWVSPTNNILSRVQTSSVGMSSLDLLDEQNSTFYGVSLKDLQKLQRLWVKCESEVQLNQNVERILDSLDTTSCEDLKVMPSTPQVSNSSTSLLLQMGMNCHVTKILRENILQKMPPLGSGLLPCDKYPDWLTFNSESSCVTFKVPQVDGRNLKTIMCVVYFSSPDNITSEGLQNVLMINCTKNTIQLYKRGALASFDEEEWQRVVSNIEPGNEVKVVVVSGNGFIVKKTTIYLIYDEDEPINEMNEHHCHEPDKNVIVSGGHENRFGRFLFVLPPLVRAVLMSRPFWFGLVGVLFWFCWRSDKRRSCNLILRHAIRWKWLVDCINKLIAYKKSNKSALCN